ncbi:MAG TPA: hypothetical protein PK750_09660 [Syntrophales bacterium]|nr:hypothetical protein [Syntrophales bacterium]
MKEILDNIRDLKTTGPAAAALVATMVALFRDAVTATVETISSLGYTLTPDKEIWVYVALAALCLERILFGRARGKE